MASSKRVVDEEEVDRHYRDYDLIDWKAVDSIEPSEKRPEQKIPNDSLLASLLNTYPNCIYKIQDYDSLFINSSSEPMNLKNAWQSFGGTSGTSTAILRKNATITNTSNSVAGQTNQVDEDNVCLYGFKANLFLDVLFLKAKQHFPNLDTGIIWKDKVPLILEELYENMDKGNTSVIIIRIYEK